MVDAPRVAGPRLPPLLFQRGFCFARAREWPRARKTGGIMERLIKLINGKRGEMYILVAFVLILALAGALFVSEITRVFNLRQHLSDELYRAANLGVKTAMYDSYMWDSHGHLDEAAAVAAFYDYLRGHLGLNNALETRGDGGLVYRVVILDIRADKTTARLEVDAVVFAPLAFFTMFGQEWEIPIRVVSRNMALF